MPIRKSFPSLNALLVLESAVRHRSFTAAAAELGVTQAAISRQVAMLEDQLGAPLFIRRHRAIEPTPPCRLLASSLTHSFARISESVDMFRIKDPLRTVTIGASTGVSALWLLPRMGELRTRFPAAQIRLVSQDSRIQLDRGEVDVLVRFGTPPFDDGQTLASRSDEVFPVCSPEYRDRLAATGTAFPDGTELLANDIPDRSWFTWTDWFLRAGVQAHVAEATLHFSHYTEVLDAARAGHGVALGWGLLVNALLKQGALVRLGNATVQPEGRYNLVVPLRQKPDTVRELLVEWLAESLSRS